MHSSSSFRWKIGCSYIKSWLESSNWQAWRFSGMQLKASWTMRHWLYRMLPLRLVFVVVLNGQDRIHALYRARLAPAACRTGIAWFMDLIHVKIAPMDSNDTSGKRVVPPTSCQIDDFCLLLGSKRIFIKQPHQESWNEVDQLHTWMASDVLSKQQKPEDIVSRMIT